MYVCMYECMYVCMYRDRNKVIDNHPITINNSKESLESNSTNGSLASDVVDIESEFNDNLCDKEDRMIINLIKNNMIKEREHDAEVIRILTGEIDFLKDEIKHKNDVIKSLIQELTAVTNYVNVKSQQSIHDGMRNSSFNKVYSWINSTEHSGDYESLNENTGPINNLGTSHNNPIGIMNDAAVSNEPSDNYKPTVNEYLHSIDIESAVNGNRIDLNNSTDYNTIKSLNHEWPKNTCLIVGDSILNNIDETRLTNRNVVVKVRAFPGSSIEDMYSYIKPLLRKKPSHLILHIGTNNTPFQSADEILDAILELKLFISRELPDCNIIISQPITRIDIMRAKLTTRDLVIKLNLLNMPMIDNSNIELEQLGKRGLHLNNWGSSKLAMNFIAHIRQL